MLEFIATVMRLCVDLQDCTQLILVLLIFFYSYIDVFFFFGQLLLPEGFYAYTLWKPRRMSLMWNLRISSRVLNILC